jgi:hypothetical protein
LLSKMRRLGIESAVDEVYSKNANRQQAFGALA